MSKNLAIGAKVLRKYLRSDEEDPYTVYLNTLSPSGRRSMRSLLMTIVKMIGYADVPEQFPWAELRYVHLAKIQSVLLKDKKSINTVNTSLAAVKGVMRVAFYMGLVSAEDYLRMQSVKRVKCKRLPVGRSLSTKEIKKLLSCQNSKRLMGARDSAVLALLLSTGVRRAEIVAIDYEDYDSRNGLMVVKQGKGARGRVVTITLSTKRMLSRWLKLRGLHNGALFTRIISEKVTMQRLSAQSVYNIVRSRAEVAGIEYCTPHDLRRTLVTRLLESGADINTVRKFIGHTDINTTARYDRRQDSVNKKIIENLAIF